MNNSSIIPVSASRAALSRSRRRRVYADVGRSGRRQGQAAGRAAWPFSVSRPSSWELWTRLDGSACM